MHRSREVRCKRWVGGASGSWRRVPQDGVEFASVGRVLSWRGSGGARARRSSRTCRSSTRSPAASRDAPIRWTISSRSGAIGLIKAVDGFAEEPRARPGGVRGSRRSSGSCRRSVGERSWPVRRPRRRPDVGARRSSFRSTTATLRGRGGRRRARAGGGAAASARRDPLPQPPRAPRDRSPLLPGLEPAADRPRARPLAAAGVTHPRDGAPQASQELGAPTTSIVRLVTRDYDERTLSAQPSPSAVEEAGRVRPTAPSGRLLLRMPPDLHADLARAAEREGTSLNGYIIGRLTESVSLAGRRAPGGSRRLLQTRTVGS